MFSLCDDGIPKGYNSIHRITTLVIYMAPHSSEEKMNMMKHRMDLFFGKVNSIVIQFEAKLYNQTDILIITSYDS